MDCTTCKEKQKQVPPVPVVVYEAGMARMERANKRVWIALILSIILLVASNLAWIVYESQFEDVVTTQEVWQEADGDGSNRFIGGDYYGETANPNNYENPNP